MNTDTPPVWPNDGIERRDLHLRRIEIHGCERSDGLYEVVGRLLDTKPHDFVPLSHSGRPVPANEPIHGMGVRLVYDDRMMVHEVHTFTDAAPYPVCPEGGAALQSLVGLRMTSGWSQEVRKRLGGWRSCAHLRELLGPMATTAFQSLSVLRMGQADRLDAQGKPVKIDSCYAYGAQLELVRMRWPTYHIPGPREP